MDIDDTITIKLSIYELRDIVRAIEYTLRDLNKNIDVQSKETLEFLNRLHWSTELLRFIASRK